MALRSPDGAYLWDLIRAGEAILTYLAGRSMDDYFADRQVRSAVVRELEIVSEAARRLTPEFRAEHDEIPWSAIIGQRNILAHEYQRIDNARIWRVAVRDLPRLIDTLKPLLPADPISDEENPG